MSSLPPPASLFVRTCQECGHKQEAKDPGDQKSEGWMNMKCRQCRSMSMDYGSYGYMRDENHKLVRIPHDDPEDDGSDI